MGSNPAAIGGTLCPNCGPVSQLQRGRRGAWQPMSVALTECFTECFPYRRNLTSWVLDKVVCRGKHLREESRTWNRSAIVCVDPSGVWEWLLS
jgi:hypothetical protein